MAKQLTKVTAQELKRQTRPPRPGYKPDLKHWKSVKALATLTILEYQRLDICCPDCCGLSEAKCETCDGSGYVCPRCAGARKLKDYARSGAIYLTACMACGYDSSEGWQYDAERELTTVEFWIEAWQDGRVTTRWASKQKEIAEVKAMTEAQIAANPRRTWKHG